MDLKAMLNVQLLNQLIKREIIFFLNTRAHPFMNYSQLTAPWIALPFGLQAAALSLQPDYIIDELNRNTKASSACPMCISFFNKGHNTFA